MPRRSPAAVPLAVVAVAAALAAPVTGRAQPGAAAVSAAVTGTVVDAATGRPLEGAQVAAAGAAAGTASATGPDGRFRVAGLAPGQVTLTVRRVGYRAATLTVAAGRANLEVALTVAPRVLEDVVVTGTAQPVERRALGNSVAQISAAAVQQVAPVPSTASLINGRAAGVVVVSGSGAIGSGPRIRIRGSSSLSLSDQPLIYVDGVRIANDVSTGPASQFFGSAVVSRLNDISPDDIQSIEIVKGPAAATLYGTEANNGVIQIITKRGAAGRTAFTIDTRAGSNYFNDAQERIGYTYTRNPASGRVERWSPVESEAARGNALFKTGGTQQYNLSLNGGSPAARYYVSSGYENSTGIEPTNDLWRYSGRANVTASPARTVDVTASVGITQQKIRLPLEAGGGMWFSAFFGRTPLSATDSLRRGFNSAPPEAFWQAFETYQRVARTLSSVTVNHRPADWLSHRLTAGYDQTGEDNVNLTQRMGADLRRFFTNPVDANGNKQTRRRELTVASLDYGATARTPLRRGLVATTSGGAQFFRRNTYALLARGEGFATGGLETVDATAVSFGGEAFLTNSTLGFYAQEQLELNNRLYLTAGLRVDDNSAFGSNFSWVQYPKVSLAWVASDEPWLRLGPVNALKLRAAYGETGQQPATFSALRTYSAITAGDGGSGVTPNNLGNPDLRPERGREVELGLDAAAFDSRVTAEVNVYRRNTTDAILSAPVAPSSGFANNRFVNVGKTRTEGVEVQTRAQLVNGRRLALEATVNASFNRNRVLDLGGVPFIGTGNIRQTVGYPVGGYWDLRAVSAQFNPNGNGTTVDAQCDNGAGGVTPCLAANGAAAAPRVFYGRSDPANEGSVSSTATLFNRVRLYGLIDWKTGHTQLNNNIRARCQIFRQCPENFAPLDNDPVLIAQYDSPNIIRNFVYQDAGFARLRELSAGYTLSPQLAARLRASTATLTLSARNLKLWTRWGGVDPEAFFVVEQFARTEQAQVPPLRQLLASLNLTF